MKLRRLILFVPLLTGVVIGIAFLPDGDGKSAQATVHRSGAMEALELWTRSRAYPLPDIPPDGYYSAFVQARTQIPENSPAGGDPPPWRSIGPVNFSGRMISVAINPLNPNTVYAGAASGGLWRSYTGGLGGDWQRITTGFPVLGVNAIGIDSSDTNVIYIGTGEVYRYGGSVGGIVIRPTRGSYGMGILKTTDGGASWTKSLDWSYNQERGVQAIRLNPLNPQSILAATSEGVYKSTDAGGSWDSVLSVLMARDIAINPNDTNLVLATCGNFAGPGTGVYRSTDAGWTFSEIAGLPLYSGMGRLCFYATDPNVVFAFLAESTTVVGQIWKSTDFGLSWNLINNSTGGDVQGWYSRFIAVHPTNSNLIVRGAQGISRSTNGGVTFTGVSGGWADYHDYAQHPTNPNILYMVDDGGVWRSTNFGSAFTYVGNGLLTSQFYNGFSSSGKDSLRALGQVQDHFGWMYTGSTTWPQGGVDEVGWTAINQQNDSTMYAGNRGGGTVYKSTNRGMNFSPTSVPGGDLRCWHTPFILSVSNPNVLYFGGSKVYKTTNAGGSWIVTNSNLALDGNPSLSMAMSATHTDTAFVGTAPLVTRSHLFRTSNGGTSWTDVTGPLPDRYPMDIAVDPRNSRVVFIAYGGFGTSHLFKSTDAGGTWTDITGILPDVPATALIVDPTNSNHVYAGTDIGVFVSTDGGSNWAGYNDGLPEAIIVSDLTVSPMNRVLRLATHSNGVFERKLLSTVITGVADGSGDRPSEFVLLQNYPNPFNPITNFEFQISNSEFVSLKIFDLAGREVATLLNGPKAPGTYRVQWDATDVASGIYFYRMDTGSFSMARKMIILK